jgi:hypothetical protein
VTKGVSFDDVMALAKPRETSVTLCLAGDLAADADRVVAALDALDQQQRRPGASLADGTERAQLTKELEELRELMQSSEVAFRFRALPSKEYSDMIAAHPSPEPGKEFDAVSLQPDIIARCCIEPVMTREQVDQLLGRLNERQRDELFGGAWFANNAAVAVPSSRVASVNPPLSGAR